MKKLLALSLVVLLALTACPHNNKIDPNAPLALTVENLAGKWVRENDSKAVYEFKTDYTYSIGSQHGDFEFLGTNQIKLTSKDEWGNPIETTSDITLYKDYLILSKTKYFKQ